MKGFFRKKLPACLLALAMLAGMVPAASAASADLTYDVDEDSYVWLDADDFWDLYDDLTGGDLEYVEFTDYDSFDDYGWFEADGFDYDDFVTGYELYESDLDDARFYYDEDDVWDDYEFELDTLEFVTYDNIDDDTLDLDVRLYGTDGSEYATVRIEVYGGSGSSGDVKLTYTVDPDDEVSLDADDFWDLFDEESREDFEYLEFYSYDDFDDYGYFEAEDEYGDWAELTDSTLDDGRYYYDWYDTSTSYDYGLDNMTFVADWNADEDTLEFPFTMYGHDDDEVDGVLYIEIGSGTGTSQGDITYQVDPDDEVTVDAEDFYDLFWDESDDDELEYIEFTSYDDFDDYGWFEADGYDYDDYVRGLELNESDLDDAAFYYDEDDVWDDYEFELDSLNQLPGFTGGSSDITGCTGNGHVGDISMKDSPETAPYSSHYNAVKYQNLKRYDPEDNMVDWTKDFYYEMTETAVIQLAQGLKYTSYDWTNVPRKMHVLEVDLSSPEIEVTTAIADDIVPNPNANRNSNNGFVIRETLSQLCARKLAEGENVLAGFNTGFFDSNDGFPRGLHIEEGEPVFINNQGVRSALTNHRWAFTVFADGTASCSQKEFKGTFEAGGKEYEYYSVNDTIVRNGHKTYMANIYTSRYREFPHADHPEITNPLSRTALYVVAEYTGSPVKVNEGYAEATVTAVYDGRTAALEKAPYLTGEDEVAIQLTGAVADEVAAAVKTGDIIKIKADVSVGGQYKSIYTQNSTMYQFLLNGKDNTGSISATNTNNTKYDPVTFVGVDQSGSKLWFFEVDGRQIDLSAGVWTSMGVKAYETYRIAEMFGAYNMTRFDGGGSSAMWVNTDGGKLVSTPSDSNGERSCMNYIYIRKK